jgi:hypothetical protein
VERAEKGLSQAAVARKAKLSLVYVSKLVSGIPHHPGAGADRSSAQLQGDRGQAERRSLVDGYQVEAVRKVEAAACSACSTTSSAPSANSAAGAGSAARSGSKVLKHYDAALTPYQRVLAAGVLTPAQQHALTQQFHALDPIALARDIQQTLDVLWKLADTRPARREAARG